MRKLRKIFKYIGYTFLYLIVSLASAYGAITISTNLSSRQSAEGQGVVPAQIQAIRDNFEEAENVDLNLGVTINSGDIDANNFSSTNIGLSAKINHKKVEIEKSNNASTLAKLTDEANYKDVISVDGTITIDMPGQTYEINICYSDNNLYFDLFGGKFRVETTNLIDSAKQLISMIGVELPDIGSIVKNEDGQFDINKILSFLSDLNELKGRRENVINVNLPIPDAPAIIQLITDKTYKLKTISLPLSKVSDKMSIEASGNVNYPKYVEIGERNKDDYANLTPIFGVASKVIPFAKQDILSFNTTLTYDDTTYNAFVSVDIKNMRVMVESEYEGLNAKVIYMDKSVYLECGNLFVKFSLDDLDKVGALLEKFGINLPIDKISAIIDKVTTGKIAEISGELNMSEFDLSSLNLDIIESINEEDGTTKVVIKDIGTISISADNEKLTAIGFTGFGIDANLEIKDAKEIALTEKEDAYANVAVLLPAVSDAIDFANNKTFSANVNIKVNEIEIPLNVTLNIENGVYLTANTNLYGKDVKVTLDENTLFIDVLSNKLKVSLDDKDTILEFVSTLLGKEISMPEVSTNLDISKIIEMVKSVLDREKTPLLVTALSVNENGELEIGAMGYALTLKTSANEISVKTEIEGISVSATVIGSNDEFVKDELNADEYTDLVDFLPIIENTTKLIQDKVAYLEINGSYNGISANGFINLNGKIELDLTASYENITAKVIFKDGILYVNAGNIAIKFNTVDLDEVAKFVKENFKIEIPYLDKISSILESENMIDAIIALIPTNGAKVDTSNLDIEEILTNLTLNISRSLIEVGYTLNGNPLTANINLGEDKISSINVNYSSITASLTLHDNAHDIAVNGEYIDIMTLMGYVDKALEIANNGTVGFNASLTYDDTTYNAFVSVDIKNMRVMVESEYEGLNAKVIYMDKSVYLECGNLFVKFSLDDLDKVGALLEKFGINLPIDKISAIIDKVTTGKIAEISGELNMSEFDLSSLNLDIIESINEEDGTTKVVIKDIGTISISADNEKLTAIGFTGFGIDANLEIKDAKEIALTEKEDAYANVAVLLPAVSDAIDFANNKTFSANVNIKVNEIEIPLNVTLNIENGVYLTANTNLYGKDVKVTLDENTLFIDVLSNKLKVSLDDKDTILEFVSTLLGKEISMPEVSTNLDISKIIEMVKSVLDREKTPLLVTALSVNENGELEIGAMGYALTLKTSANEISVKTEIEGISVSATVIGSNDEFVKDELNADEYTDLVDFLPIIENTTKLIQDKVAYLEINGSYNGISANGFINLNGKIELDLTASYENITAKVIFKDGILYVNAGNIAIKFNTVDLDEVAKFVKENFKIEIPYLDKISSILESENMIDAIIALIPTDGAKVDTSNLDIEEILTNLTLNISRSLIEVGYTLNGNSLTASVNLGEGKISSINVNYSNITASLTLYDNAHDIAVNGEYIDIMTLMGYVDKALQFVKAGHIKALAEIIFLDNGQKVNASVQADYSSQIKLGAILSSNDIDGLDISFFVEEGVLYFNYNGLLIKIDNKAFGEILSIALEFFGIDPSTIPFLDKVDLDFNLKEEIGIDTGIADIDPMKMIKYLDYISGLYTNGNDLVISLNGKLLYGDDNAQDILISFTSTESALTGIQIDNIYNSNRSRQISAKLEIQDWTGYQGVDKSKNYVDISRASDLIKALVNMVTTKDFHIAGTFNVNGKLAGIELASAIKALGKNNVIPFDIRVKIVDKKPEIAIVLGEIPAVVKVNNDVPYEFGDTESGDNRFLYIYYKDDAIYLYRSETVDVVFGAGKRSYEKATKISLDRLLEDPMYYVQYSIGFTDAIINAMKESMSLASNRTTPMDYSNILKPIEIVDANSFRVSINMAEIANNPQLGIMSILFRTDTDKNNKNYVSHLEFGFDLPLKGDTVNLKLDSNNIDLVNYLDPVDMSALYEYVNSYTHAYDEEWEASKGKWTKASEKIYTIKFNSNGGNTVSDMAGSYKTPISLPTLPDIINDNGIYKSTKVFGGWYTSEEFADNTLFTSTTMPRRDTTLYAKWVETIVYYRTITFVTNSTFTCDSITRLAGSEITLFELEDKEETIDSTTIYSHFAGWYTSADFAENTEFNDTIMPDFNVTLYAKWNVYKVEKTASFKLYHNDELLSEKQVKVGDKAELTNSLINETTKYYLDKDFSEEYTGTFEIVNDLTLYIRNKYHFSYSSSYGDAFTNEFDLYEGEEMPALPSQSTYVEDDGKTRVTYTFKGYSDNLTIAPDRNVDIIANWEVETKYYYTVNFDLRWYIVFDTVAGSGWKDAPAAISAVTVLEGTTLNLNESKYIVQGRAYTSAVRPGKFTDWSTKAYFKSTSWGTSQWADYTKAGSGFTSYTVTGNATLYACWQKV